jgi:hypothetical protein
MAFIDDALTNAEKYIEKAEFAANKGKTDWVAVAVHLLDAQANLLKVPGLLRVDERYRGLRERYYALVGPEMPRDVYQQIHPPGKYHTQML